MTSFNPELQLKNTEFAIKNKPKNLKNELRRLKFVITLGLNDDKTKYINFYANPKAETINYSSDIYNIFEPMHITIVTKIQKCYAESLSWTID